MNVSREPLSRSALFLIGISAIIFGIINIAWPGITITVVAIMWGAFALADGIASFFRPQPARSARVLQIISGIFGVIAGLIVLTQPFVGVVFLTWVLSFWFILRGIIELTLAFSLRKLQNSIKTAVEATEGNTANLAQWKSRSPILLGVAGVLWILAGILVISHPGQSIISITIWVGILAVIWGIVFLVLGFTWKARARADLPRERQV